VLVLPQRQPVLVAKQLSSIDTLSGGRVRCGVGVGWQPAEFDALEERFSDRGRRMNEAIKLLRAYWGDERVDFHGEFYTSTAMAMEPKPPQGADLPIWIGGGSQAALRRVAELGDGWMGTAMIDDDKILAAKADITRYAEEIERDPAEIGWQMMLQPPPSRPEDKDYYADHDRVVARTVALVELGFQWVSLNATAVFQAGARSVDAMIDELAALHDKIRAEVG
jgi:probable F420-dependent oxidoreductase